LSLSFTDGHCPPAPSRTSGYPILTLHGNAAAYHTLLAFSCNHIEFSARELAAVFLEPAFALLPIAFDLVPIQRYLPFAMSKLTWQSYGGYGGQERGKFPKLMSAIADALALFRASAAPRTDVAARLDLKLDGQPAMYERPYHARNCLTRPLPVAGVCGIHDSKTHNSRMIPLRGRDGHVPRCGRACTR
jgi:hypothetical protein